LSEAQITEAVAYTQEEGGLDALTEMDDDDFNEMVEEMALGDDEEKFREAVRTIGSQSADFEPEPEPQPQSKKAPKEGAAKAWLKTLGYLSEEQITEAVAYTQEEGGLDALTEMDDDDFNEMVEEMALGDDEEKFREAVRTIGS